MDLLNRFLNTIISGGLFALTLGWIYERWQDKKTKEAFLNLLISEIFFNIHALKANIERFDQILSSQPNKNIKYMFSFDAWGVIKGSGKAHLFSSEELYFFVSKYALIKKCETQLLEWSHLPELAKSSSENVKSTRDKFAKSLEIIQNSDFLKKKTHELDAARERILVEGLKREGKTDQEVDAILWQFKN